MFFFFFKQKTAYDILRSDWSSDVCSSDLGAGEEVEHCRAFGEAVVGENVEEAFAHPVGGGPEMRPGVALAEARKLQTLQAAADDPHAFRSGLRSADASAITAGSGDLPASMSLLPTM